MIYSLYPTSITGLTTSKTIIRIGPVLPELYNISTDDSYNFYWQLNTRNNNLLAEESVKLFMSNTFKAL